MAATIIVNRLTGAGPTATDVTGINTRLDRADAHTTGSTTDPVMIPTSGYGYSYWATFQVECTDMDDATEISNFRFFTDGANGFGTGVELMVGKAPYNGYTQAVGGALNTTNYSTLTADPYSAHSSYPNIDSPLSIGGLITATGSGDVDLLVLQMRVINTASPGATGVETMFLVYDEV